MGLAILLPDADFSATGLGAVTLKASPSSVANIIIQSPEHIIATTFNMSATLLPLQTTPPPLSWSIVSGGSYASISSGTGVLTIGESATKSSVTVRCELSGNSDVYDEKTILVSYSILNQPILLMPDNITLKTTDNYIEAVFLKTSSSINNYLERMLYTTIGNLPISTFPDDSTYSGASAILTPSMKMIEVPNGASYIKVSGSNLYFNSRNVRVTFYSSSYQLLTENTLSSVPTTIAVPASAAYVYIRITKANASDDYVVPFIQWL